MVKNERKKSKSKPNYYCPRCGRRVTISVLRNTENAYPFQCAHCDEDFYTFECLTHEERYPSAGSK